MKDLRKYEDLNARSELIKKIHILGIIRRDGTKRALHLFPRMADFIRNYATIPYEDAKTEILRENEFQFFRH